jgi:hypothetical protein
VPGDRWRATPEAAAQAALLAAAAAQPVAYFRRGRRGDAPDATEQYVI